MCNNTSLVQLGDRSFLLTLKAHNKPISVNASILKMDIATLYHILLCIIMTRHSCLLEHLHFR